MNKFFESILDSILYILPDFIISLVILTGGFFLTKLLIRIANRYMSKAKMDFSLKKFFLNAIRISCYILLIITSLGQLGISTTGILACFSAAAAAIALALKDSLSNIASGIILLFSRPFVTGDFIQIGEESGFVQQIDLIHTKILTYDNRGIMIPNGVISSNQVINYSKMPKRRVDFKIPVAYGSDIEAIKKIIEKAIINTKDVDKEPLPFVRVLELSDSSVVLVARGWADTEKYWDVYHDMIENIISALENERITIPYNQLDVHLVK